MSDVGDEKDFQNGDGSRRGKKRRSKKKKQRKPIADINFGDGSTAADASKSEMDVENNDAKQVVNDENRAPSPDSASPATKRVVHNVQTNEDGGTVEITETTIIKHADDSGHEDGSTATDASHVEMDVYRDDFSQTVNQVDRSTEDDAIRSISHKVETGEDGEIVEITETKTIRHEGGESHKNDDDNNGIDVGDLEEGESTILVDLQHDGHSHTETTTELDSGPVTVENYEEQLDDNTTVQVEHISQTLTTTKTIVITEDGQEVEVDANDPNVEYIEEEPEIITEEITQTIRRRKIITKTPDGREIETFEDVVVTDDEDAENEDPEVVTTVTVTQDDQPTEGHTIPTSHVFIAPESGKREDDAVVVSDEEEKVPQVEENIQMFVETKVESELNFDDLSPPVVDNETSKDACVESSDDEPAVHIDMPAKENIESDGEHDRERSESQRSTSYIINAPSKENKKPLVRDTVKIYIRAEEPTPQQEERPRASVNIAKQRPIKEEVIEKRSLGSRDGMDEWVLVNFKHDEVLAFIELLKNLPFNYDLSTEVPQSQCSCW